MNRATSPGGRPRGQILVLFALGIVAVVAMVGLVLDGGDAFNQRRGEQNGADLAALAGANAYLNTYMSTKDAAGSSTAATAAARVSATGNGYTNGSSSTVAVTVSLLPHGATV